MSIRWFLPNGHPIFWNEVRRRLLVTRPMHPLVRAVNYVVRGVLALALLAFSAFLTYMCLTEGAGPELFWTLLLVQIFGLGLACPGVSAWVFTEEREKGTFDVLLSLPIRARDIVQQKYTYLLLMVSLVYLVFLPPSIEMLLRSPLSWLLGYAAAFASTGCFLACGVMMGCIFRSNWIASLVSYGTTVVLMSGILSAILTNGEVRDGLFQVPTFLYTALILATLLFTALTVLFLALASKAIERLREVRRN